MILISSKTGLLLIDVQIGFDDPRWGARNNPNAEQVMSKLLEKWRTMGWPVFHVQHLSTLAGSPLHPQSDGSDFKPQVRPLSGEPLFVKHVNSAFIGTQLEKVLRAQGIEALVIVGLTTPHCVSTTARMAANLGFQVYMPKDGIAAFELTGPDGKHYSADEVHNISLATLHEEFATVIDSQTLLDAIPHKP